MSDVIAHVSGVPLDDRTCRRPTACQPRQPTRPSGGNPTQAGLLHGDSSAPVPGVVAMLTGLLLGAFTAVVAREPSQVPRRLGYVG